jgi:radical SAM protein with 4Fe4S-binding SPASM domain
LAAARDLALESARGRILAFVGEDIGCHAATLLRHLEVYRAVGDAVVITPVLGSQPKLPRRATPSASPLAEQTVERPTYRVVPDEWLLEHAPWALIGDCWSAPAGVLRAAGGWDAAASMAARGDEDLAWRLWKSGLPVIVDTGTTAVRVHRPRYPGSRWRGTALDVLPRQRGGSYAAVWGEVRAAENAILDHNRHHSRRAIIGQAPLHEWGMRLSGLTPPLRTVAVPVCSPADARRALDLAVAGDDLLLLDRSPAGQTHLVAAEASRVAGARVIRDVLVLEAVRLTVLDWRLGRLQASGTVAQPGIAAVASLRDWARGRGRRLSAMWPEWLMSVARGESVTALAPPLPGNAPSIRTRHRRRPRTWNPPGPGDGWPRGPVEEGYAHPPLAIAVRVTNHCNMRCAMCGQHGPTGNLVGRPGAELAFESLLKLVNAAAEARVRMFYIWGGEPFLRRDAVDLIAAAKRAKLFTAVTTNGYFLEDTAEALVATPLDSLRLSLDGPPAIHDAIRGVPGLFDRVMGGVRVLNAYKKKTGRELPALELECTISPLNCDSLRDMPSIAAEAGAYALNFSHLVYTTPEEGRRRDAIFRRLFGRPAWTWRGFCLNTTMDYRSLARTLHELEAAEQPVPVRFTPFLPQPSAVADHYRRPYRVYGRKACCAPWVWAEVHPDGELYFCDDFHDIGVGNVADQPLKEVWNGPRARAYRRELLARGRFPGCINCGLLNLDAAY